MKLNLGCRDDVREGYVNIDRYYEAPHVINLDVCALDYLDNSVEEILAHSILEHLHRDDARRAIKEWARVLQPGGTLSLIVPDLRSMAKWFAEEKFERVVGQLYGTNEAGQWHRSAWWHEELETQLNRAGLRVVGWDRWMDDIKLRAVKGAV